MADKCVACGHSVVTGCISDVKASVSHYDAWEPNSTQTASFLSLQQEEALKVS